MTLLVNAEIMAVAAKTGIHIGLCAAENDFSGVGMEIMGLVIINIVFQAILMITYFIVDPFGTDALDFPVAAYTNHWKLVHDAFFEAQATCLLVCEDGSM